MRHQDHIMVKTDTTSLLTRSARSWWIAAAILVGIAAALAPHLRPFHPRQPPQTLAGGTEPAIGTSAEALAQRIKTMEARLQQQPDDVGAAVQLADALLRQARATTDGRPANRAAEVLK